MFGAAFLLAGAAIVERAVNLAGYTVFRGRMLPSRLLELAAIALLFVIAIQLRDLKPRDPGT